MGILRLLLDLALALGLLTACAAAGRLALGRLGFDSGRAVEDLTFSTAVGGGLLATAILACGALGGLRPPLLGALVFVFGLVARREVAELPALLRAAAAELEEGAGRIGLGILAAVAFFLVVQAATPPVDWDSLMYHLRVPAQLLERGRIYLPEDNLHTAFVQLIHMLYLPLLAFGSPSAPALLSALLALLLGLATFALCRRFLPGRAAGWSLAWLWGNASLVLVAVTPRVDVSLAFYLFLAHFALLRAFREPAREGSFHTAAILLGFALGVKYHALAYGLALSPLVVAAAWHRTRLPAPALRALAGFALLAATAALPWLLKNWALLGAPFYPFPSSWRLEPWLARLYGSSAIPASVGTEVFQVLRHVRSPFNLLDLLREPGRLTVEREGALYSLSPLLLALPLYVAVRRDRTLQALLFPALAYLALVLLPSPTTNLRYLIPALAPLTLVAAHATATVSGRFLPSARMPAAFLVLTALALAPTANAVLNRWSQARPWAYLAGALAPQDYLRAHLDPEVFTYAHIVSVVNREVPRDARILLLLEARGFYFDREVLQDNLLTNWPFVAPLVSDGDCLQLSGVTHVLVSYAAADYYTRRGLDPALLRWNEFAPFAERCLTPAYARYGFILYRLRR